MRFITDKQTLEDLNLTGKFKSHSLFNLFNQVHTGGGERLLDKMFREPMTDAEAINLRSSTFQYFQSKKLTFPFSKELFSQVENYLSFSAPASPVGTLLYVYQKRILKAAVHDEHYDQVESGLKATMQMLQQLHSFYTNLQGDKDYPGGQLQLEPLRRFFTHRRMQRLHELTGNIALPVKLFARYHHLLLHVFRNEMEQLLELIYHIDVYIAVSDVSRARSLHYGQALPQEQNIFRTSALSHPAIEHAVANPLTFDKNQNLLFLTGANMAGKSTLMKSFGIAIYMAHMGFPVAAKDLVFSVREGLYTSINVPDNLNRGYSHFYAEVLRVKHVAEEVTTGKDLVVIFDELFKGTNVKDACDATLAVTASFSEYKNCLFIISTHIIEVGYDLQNYGNNIAFGYMPTVLEGNSPRYSYRLTKGITNDRQGMLIIENEGIFELLNS